MIYGTSHFATILDAEWYYYRQNFTAQDVAQKIKDGEIGIGRPQTKENETLFLDSDNRYHIREIPVLEKFGDGTWLRSYDKTIQNDLIHLGFIKKSNESKTWVEANIMSGIPAKAEKAGLCKIPD